jgi:tetratricopeptide (TPR) repeat protein
MSFSFLYLAIAERLGLPLYLVNIPNHFFVRYDDGTTRFNIETLEDGEPAPDDYYVQWKSIAPALVEKGVYLKDRSKREAVGLALRDVARLFAEKNQQDRSLEVMKKSLLFYPENPEALSGLGGAYLQMYGDSAAAGQPENAAWLDEAIRLSREALAINPDYIDALINLGTAEMVRADYAAAGEAFRKVLSLQPDYGPAHQRLAAVYATTGDYGLALEQADKAAELGWPIEQSSYEEIKKNAGQRHSF